MDLRTLEEVCLKLPITKTLNHRRVMLIYQPILTDKNVSTHSCNCNGKTYIALEVDNSVNLEYNPTIRIIKNLAQWNDIIYRIEQEQWRQYLLNRLMRIVIVLTVGLILYYSLGY